MSNPNTTIGSAELSTALREFTIDVAITAPANGTYNVSLEFPVASTLIKVSAKLTSGTCTVETRIDNVAVVLPSAATTIACSSTKNSKVPASAYAIGEGSYLDAIVAASSSPVNLILTYRFRRNAT